MEYAKSMVALLMMLQYVMNRDSNWFQSLRFLLKIVGMVRAQKLSRTAELPTTKIASPLYQTHNYKLDHDRESFSH